MMPNMMNSNFPNPGMNFNNVAPPVGASGITSEMMNNNQR